MGRVEGSQIRDNLEDFEVSGPVHRGEGMKTLSLLTEKTGTLSQSTEEKRRREDVA